MSRAKRRGPGLTLNCVDVGELFLVPAQSRPCVARSVGGGLSVVRQSVCLCDPKWSVVTVCTDQYVA